MPHVCTLLHIIDIFFHIGPLSVALPEPLTPLPRQKYFHGCISRIESEALLEKDGQFLIRESSKRPGQYVLTGMANGQPQHLLLMDKDGKVRSDRLMQGHFTFWCGDPLPIDVVVWWWWCVCVCVCVCV